MASSLLLALALLLGTAAAFDILTRRIPNSLAAAGLAVGLAGHAWTGGGVGLAWSLAGVAAALPLLLLYAARLFGAGDVKLLMAVGALAGPIFLPWTLLGAVFVGGVIALVWIISRSLVTRSIASQKSRMPFAPAIALGAAFAFVHLHWKIL